VSLLWQEVGGAVHRQYFTLTRQDLDGRAVRSRGQVNESAPLNKSLLHASEIAEGLAGRPPLATSHARIALSQALARNIGESVGSGLVLEGVCAADVARESAQ
jgi:enoyl-CoA hydratase/carnithine racemase